MLAIRNLKQWFQLCVLSFYIRNGLYEFTLIDYLFSRTFKRSEKLFEMVEVGDSESCVKFCFIDLFIELNLTRKHKTLLVFENRLFGFLHAIKLAVHAEITLVILSCWSSILKESSFLYSNLKIKFIIQV